MIHLLLALVSLQAAPGDDLAAEGETLGRYSTLFAVCQPYYATDINAGHSLANDFVTRSSAAGWSDQDRADAYARGQNLERVDIDLRTDGADYTPAEARAYLLEFLPRIKARCRDLGRLVPGSVPDVDAGDRRLEAEVKRLAGLGAPPAHPRTPQRFNGYRSAYVQGTLNIAAGERATLRRNANGTYDLIKVERIDVSDVQPPSEGSRDPMNGASEGTLRFGLHARQDVGSLLKVENSQGQGLKYSGQIVRYVAGQNRGPTATSVCTVPSGMVTFEHWPEPVVQVVIGGLQRSDDALPTCPAHVDD